MKYRQTSERKELWATKLPRVFQHGGICDNASRMRELNIHLAKRAMITKQALEQKKCLMFFNRMFDGVQTRSNIIKQGGQTVKCLMMFGRQTFPVWSGLWEYNEPSILMTSTIFVTPQFCNSVIS